MRHDYGLLVWIIFIAVAAIYLAAALSGCVPEGKVLAPVKPPPSPAASATPTKSACEYEVDDLRADNERLRDLLRDGDEYIGGEYDLE